MHKVQAKRRSFLQSFCKKYNGNLQPTTNLSQMVSRIYVEEKHKILYCEVPKAGCSNWKRTLMVLSGLAPSIDKISHNAVHYGKHLHKLDNFDVKGIYERLDSFTKVIVVRNPMERLVSAFRDKFEHPNNYYHPVFGKAIIKMYRKNATQEALTTGSGVTFKEFVQYLLDSQRPMEPLRGVPYAQVFVSTRSRSPSSTAKWVKKSQKVQDIMDMKAQIGQIMELLERQQMATNRKVTSVIITVSSRKETDPSLHDDYIPSVGRTKQVIEGRGPIGSFDKPEHPQPRRDKPVSPAPKKRTPTCPEPKKGKPKSPVTEGEPHQSSETEDYLLLPPPPPEGDYLLLPPPPPEGNLPCKPQPPLQMLLRGAGRKPSAW
ncbi:CHST9 sulfotransferase, partial [Polyodon spathula]|nr:CHST9 sulfotransferase [Polyodon spathula]